MSNSKREQERDELFKSLERVADELRGTTDGWNFKQYVLGTLFYRFVSENLTNYINSRQKEAGYDNSDYTTLDDETAERIRSQMLEEKGFFIKPSELFENVCSRAANDPDLNKTLKNVFIDIEESSVGTASEESFKGLFDDFDLNSVHLGSTFTKRNQKLMNLLLEIKKLNFNNYQDSSIDLFGDAYERLMGMYAANAGRSGGEYFTPQEVSELLARITVVGKTKVNKVYDPACGSGSLLLKFAKVLGKDNVKDGFYGQEVNVTTYNLCRINMFLHDINYKKFDISHGDTLDNPQHMSDEPFEAIVSNPPYSIKWAGDSNPILINDERFSPAGVLAPKSKADLAFVMHCLSWLATNGTAAIVSFPGVMYRGGAEKKIRKYLVDNNFVDAVIQLPTNLFYGTTIATCILVIKKNKVDNKVLFIDATKEFIKSANKSKLSDDNARKILESYTKREDIEYFAKAAKLSEIQEKDYNLSVGSYVEAEDTREKVNIIELEEKIDNTVSKITRLRTDIDAIVADLRSSTS